MSNNKATEVHATESPKGGRAMSRREVLVLLAAFGITSTDESFAQDAAKVNPRSYRVVLENDKVRVLEYRSLPGMGVCGQGVHSHPAHLTIPMTDGKAKATLEDGKVVVVEGKAGEVFWAPAETHAVENIFGRPMRAFLVEIKDKEWKPSTG